MTPFWIIKDKIINFMLVTQYRHGAYQMERLYKRSTEFASARIWAHIKRRPH